MSLEALKNLLKNVSTKGTPENLLLLRTVRSAHASNVRNRVHVQGKNADGTSFGSYSDSYFKYVRKKKGRLEPQSKKVLSLTRQLEEEIALASVSTSGDSTISLKDERNVKVFGYLEQEFGNFYTPSDEELEMIEQGADEILQSMLNNIN